MATPKREDVETFMSVTGASESVALQKLQEHLCNLNEAVDSYFNEGGSAIIDEVPVTASHNDSMDLDNPSLLAEHQRDPFSLLSAGRNLNPLSILNPNFHRSLFGQNPGFTNRAPFVSHPREVREIPIECKDENRPSGQSGCPLTIEDVTESVDVHGPEIRGTVIIDDDSDENYPTAATVSGTGLNEQNHGSFGDSPRSEHCSPNVPKFDEFPDYDNDIEAEMLHAAIEASKREVEGDCLNKKEICESIPSPMENVEPVHSVSLSLKTADQRKASCGQLLKAGTLDEGALQRSAALNGRLENGCLPIKGEAEDVEEQSLVRRRARNISSSSTDPVKHPDKAGPVVVSTPSSPLEKDVSNRSEANSTAFHSDVWGGISSEEHDEAVMLEAAMFGGVAEDSSYGFPYAPHQFMQPRVNNTMGSYPRQPRPPSPSLEAQRMIREQQDDEYLASLQADQEKEMKAREDAEACRVMELAARESALEEERLKEENFRKKLEEEEEFERLLGAKEASLPPEPPSDDENAVTLLVRMPDGSRLGRRFLKVDKLQFFFDFIDVGRRVKPGTYRLVRPYPRLALGDREVASSLNELGLTSKQEALFLELI